MDSSDPLYRHRARRAVKKAVQEGRLRRFPCFTCGAAEVEAHHPDYAQRLSVVWLCRLHHQQLHREHYEALGMYGSAKKDPAPRPRQFSGRDLPTGVQRRQQRFRAQIEFDGRCRSLGTFDTPEEASAAYQAAWRERAST